MTSGTSMATLSELTSFMHCWRMAVVCWGPAPAWTAWAAWPRSASSWRYVWGVLDRATEASWGVPAAPTRSAGSNDAVAMMAGIED